MICRSPIFTGVSQQNRAWNSWSGDVRYVVEDYWEPESLEDLVWVTHRATTEAPSKHVKAVGSGWSYEDVSRSDDFLISLSSLDHQITDVIAGPQLALLPNWRQLHNATADDELLHVQAGITIWALNDLLASLTPPLAMRTLGGSGGQTIAGAISTSTHGGDIDEPPFPDLIRAIHMVGPGGQEYWIESSSTPITDPAILAQKLCPDARIIQDDDVLHAAKVTVGRFGVIYSVVLAVRHAYRLAEWTTPQSWAVISPHLLNGIGAGGGNELDTLLNNLPPPPVTLGANTANRARFLEIFFASQAPANCWVRRRWETTAPDLNPPVREPDALCTTVLNAPILDAAAGALGVQAGILALIPFWGWAKSAEITARVLELQAMQLDGGVNGYDAFVTSLNALWASELGWPIPHLNEFVFGDRFGTSIGDGIRARSDLVMAGFPPEPRTDCLRSDFLEVIFPTNSRAYIDFLNEVAQLGLGFRQAGYFTCRFSASSAADLSMHKVAGDHSVSIEFSSLKGLAENLQWLDAVEALAIASGGRPHWGQKNSLTSVDVQRLYDADLNHWKEQLVRLTGADMTFSNSYTVLRGLEPIGIERRVTHSRKDAGDITALCNPGESWSPVLVAQAIDHISSGLAIYFVEEAGQRVDIHVVNAASGAYLRTAPDSSAVNNLDNLPDC